MSSFLKGLVRKTAGKRRLGLATACLALALPACKPAPAAPPPVVRVQVPPSAARCSTFDTPKQTGQLQTGNLDELSGLAVSRRQSGVLWAHGDGGHKPRLHALAPDGQRRATWKLKGAPVDDWEDLALGPCSLEPVLAGSDCLYLADTGDNEGKREVFRVLRLAEPQVPPTLPDGPLAVDEAAIEVYPFRFPDGGQDVEALAVLPDTRVILLTKRNDGRSFVYRLTLRDSATATAERLGTLDLRSGGVDGGAPLRVTAADLTPDGRWLLVRTYTKVRLFELGAALAAEAPAAEQALAQAQGTDLPAGSDVHGEAVAWDPAGGFWQASEGAGTPLWRVGCRGGSQTVNGPKSP